MMNIVDVSCPWPWIVFVGGQKTKNQVFCDVVSNSKITSFTISIPEFIAKRSASVPTNINGWFLVLQSSSDQPCLWNAVTLKSIDLPPLKLMSEYCIDYVFLTKYPNDCNCMVLLFMGEPLGIHYCYANGDNDWTFRENQEELMEFRGGYERLGDKFVCPVAIDDDKIITISYSKVVAKIETVKPKRLIIKPCHRISKPHPHVVVPCIKTPMYWVACCGDLFVIYVTYGGHAYKQIVSIDIFKLDFSNMSWKKVHSCPNVAFFLRGFFIRGQQGRELGFACPVASANSSKKGNRVYIVEYEEEEEEVRLLLHTYHIQQKTLKTSLIATLNNEFEPYWILVSDGQAIAKAEEDYRNGGDDENDHLFVKQDNTELMIVHNDYEDEEKKFSMKLENLPVDILEIISSHLTNLLDYLNFRATKRFFRDKFSKKMWRNMRASKRDTSQSPWLIFPKSQQVGKGVFSMVDLVSRNKHNVRTPKALEENLRICYSANGWLLMSSPYFKNNMVKGFNLLFYNPVSKSTIYLPKLPAFDASHFLFTGSPDCEESCTILGVSRYMKSNIEYGECPSYYIISKESGEDEWGEWEMAELKVEYEDGYFHVQQSNVNVVIVGSVFYFLVGDGNIAYISYVHQTIGIHRLEEPCSKSSYEQCFLAPCDEVLHSIYIGKDWTWLRAFKFNESDMVWDEVKDLKGNNLYLSYVSSTVLEPQSSNVGNKIYFSRFYQGSVIYYSFNTHQFHLNDGKDSVMSDYYGSKEQMYSCWIEPSWKLDE